MHKNTMAVQFPKFCVLCYQAEIIGFHVTVENPLAENEESKDVRGQDSYR